MKPFPLTCALLVLLLGWLFRGALAPDRVVFSNDGPLGTVVNPDSDVVSAVGGIWVSTEHLGRPYPSFGVPGVSYGFRFLCSAPGLAALAVVFLGAIFWLGRHNLNRWIENAVLTVNGLVMATGLICLGGMMALDWHPAQQPALAFLLAAVFAWFPFMLVYVIATVLDRGTSPAQFMSVVLVLLLGFLALQITHCPAHAALPPAPAFHETSH